MAYVRNELLSRLVGDRLVAVTFVLDDYLQLQFDNASMNVSVWPAVHYGGGIWRGADVGYSDCLRHLCGSAVEATSEMPDDGLRITLEAGEIHINPSREEIYSEIATLHLGRPPGDSAPGEWMCWRPGEESFEHLA